MSIDSISGLPSHPLVVHIPVVGIPLVALMLAAYVVIPRWRASLFWPTGIGIAVVTIATILAAQTGESLEHALSPEDRASAQLHRHTQLGDQTRTIVILFALVSLGFLGLEWWKHHNRRETVSDVSGETHRLHTPAGTRLVLVVGAFAVLLGGVATIWDVRTGHAGATSAWGDVSPSNSETTSGS